MYILFSQIHAHFVQSSTCTLYMYMTEKYVHIFDGKQNIRLYDYNQDVHVFDYKQNVHVVDLYILSTVKYMDILFSQIHVHFVQSNTCTFNSAKYIDSLPSQIHVYFVQSNICTFCSVKYMYILLLNNMYIYLI
jgi:hypothetical protein